MIWSNALLSLSLETTRAEPVVYVAIFNNDKADEFQLPDRNVTKDFRKFGAACKVPVPRVVCEDGCDFCPKCDDPKKSAFEVKCAIITNPKDPFAACHDVVEPASYCVLRTLCL